MKIALVQFNTTWEKKQTNFERAEVFINQAVQKACDIVVFPEMFSTGFSRNIAAIAEDENGETASFLSNMAKANHINLIGGYSEKAAEKNKGRNVAAVYDRNGTLVAKYTKIHPFSFSKEDKYFTPGNRLVTFNLEGTASSLGASHVFDPAGSDLCAGSDTEEFLLAEFCPDDVQSIRTTFPALHDMHPISLDFLEKTNS